MKKIAVISAAFTAVAALSAPNFASAATPTAQTQVKANAAGQEVSLGSTGATAVASALVTAEDGGSKGYIDVTITGDGSFSVSPDQMRIVTDQGKTIAVAAKLTERNPETNQRIREVKKSETIEAGATKSFRFEFSGNGALNDAGKLSALNNSKGALAAAWHIR